MLLILVSISRVLSAAEREQSTAARYNLNDQDVADGYFNLHWSKEPFGDGCLGMKCRSEHICSNNETTGASADPMSRLPFLMDDRPCEAELASARKEAEEVTGILGKHFVPLQPSKRVNAVPENPAGNMIMLTDDTDDHGRDLMRRNCYAWYDRPIHRHLMCIRCLGKELLTKGLHQITCPGCGKMISPMCIIEYIKKVVLESSGGTNPSGLPHRLTNRLIEKFVGSFDERVFLFAIRLKSKEEIGKMMSYLREITHPLQGNAGNPIKIELGGLPVCITAPETIKRIDHLIIRLTSVVENTKSISETEDLAVGLESRKRKIDGDAEANADTMNMKILYAKSLNFVKFIEDSDDLCEYIATTEGIVLSRHKICYFHAKIFFLLNNPKIPVGLMANYMSPYLVKAFDCGSHPIMSYINEYRESCNAANEYRESCNVARRHDLHADAQGPAGIFQEVELEAIAWSKNKMLIPELLPVVLPFLRRGDVTLERLLRFVYRTAEYFEPGNTARSVQTLTKIVNIIADEFRLKKPISFKELLMLDNLSRGYPNIETEKLKTVRNSYIKSNHGEIYENIRGDMLDTISRMGRTRVIISLQGLFELFQHNFMSEDWLEFFRDFCTALPNQDMILLYIPEMAFNDVIRISLKITSFLKELSGETNLQLFYMMGASAGLIRKLLGLQGSEGKKAEFLATLREKTGLYQYRKNMTNYEDIFKGCLHKPGAVSTNAKFLYGFACFYNALIDSLSAEFQYHRLNLYILSEHDNRSIFKFLCQYLLKCTLPVHCSTLSMIMPSVFSRLKDKALYSLFRLCLDNEAASDPAKIAGCSEVLMRVCLEHNLNARRQALVNLSRASKAQLAEYDEKAVDAYISSEIDAYEKLVTNVGPGEFFVPKNVFRTTADIKTRVSGILGNLARLGYDVNRNRGLFYQKIFPFIAVDMVKLAQQLVLSDFSLPQEIQANQHVLQMAILDILLN